jgi:hypothetical protein
VVVVGSARTLLLQSTWDRIGLFPAQSSLLRQLVQIAPDLRPNSLVILVAGSRVFPEVFTFRHALDLLYGPKVAGFVLGAHDFLYTTRFAADAVSAEPWPIIRGPWEVDATRHRYDETLAVELLASGELRLLESWPPSLPALPEGARYTPRDRRLAASADRPARALLGPNR